MKTKKPEIKVLENLISNLELQYADLRPEIKGKEAKVLDELLLKFKSIAFDIRYSDEQKQQILGEFQNYLIKLCNAYGVGQKEFQSIEKTSV